MHNQDFLKQLKDPNDYSKALALIEQRNNNGTLIGECKEPPPDPSGPTRAQLLRVAETDARFLAKRTFACGAPRAAAIRAALAHLRGDPAKAEDLLMLAQEGFARVDMTAHAAAAALAAAIVGRSGERADADTPLVAEGVRSPAAFAGMLVPGPWTLEA